MLSRLMRQMPEVDEDETLARPAQVAMEGLASVEEAVLADRMDLGRFFESKVQPVYAALDDCIRLGEIGAMYSAKVEA
ncbi:hypothetical protein CMO91_06365 [Candidatus Woesearchaeota archaeon]|nr:hypothetical protein [Candidatus Woesearchaeota archaeon]